MGNRSRIVSALACLNEVNDHRASRNANFGPSVFQGKLTLRSHLLQSKLTLVGDIQGTIGRYHVCNLLSYP